VRKKSFTKFINRFRDLYVVLVQMREYRFTIVV